MMNPETTYFAKTNFRNRERVFGIQKVDRRQHMYVIGQTGTGKSTLLKNVALQDIKSGRGVCIVDPHGEFVEDVLTMIPPERAKDVVYFNPADSEFPIGFNVLEIPDPKNPEYKPIAASSLMGIFTKIWANVWSARMEYILNNAILALLDNPGSTLLGVQRILVDKEYRKQVLSNVTDPVVRSFWLQEYEQYDPRFRNEAIAPIQNKVGQFLSSSIVRNIIGQPYSTLNMYDAMNDEKILLVNVSKGRIGEDNSQLLGAMIITKLQLAAMERVRIPEEERKDFYLYVDEFQNFATDSFASILSEARKYRLNLVMAHQYINQLVTETSTRVRDAVFGNVGTMVVFRIGATDAEFLENEFAPEVTIEDLVGLPNRQIFIKLMINNVRSRPFSASTLPPLAIETEKDAVIKIIEHSRSVYARSRGEVEKEIASWSGFERMERQAEEAKQQPERQKRFGGAPSPVQEKRSDVLPQRPKREHQSMRVEDPVPAKQEQQEERAVSLSALRPREAEEKREEHAPRQVQPQRRSSPKQNPASLTELRSLLSGIVGGRAKEPKAPHRENAKQQPAPAPKSEEKNTGSLKPGERIKL